MLDEHRGDASYYLLTLWHSFFPWVIMLPFALACGVRDALRGVPFAAVLVGLVVIVLGTITFVSTKLPWYVVPLYPAAAILIAAMLVRGRLVARFALGITGVIVILVDWALAPMFLVTWGGAALIQWLAGGGRWMIGSTLGLLFFVSVSSLPSFFFWPDSAVAMLSRWVASDRPRQPRADGRPCRSSATGIFLANYTLLQRSSGRRSAERDRILCRTLSEEDERELIAQATAIDSLPPRYAVNIIARSSGAEYRPSLASLLRGMPPIDVVAGPIEFVYGTIGDVGDANP